MAFIRLHAHPAVLAGPRGGWLKARSCALHRPHRLQVDPRPVAPTFFSDRSQAITPELSIRLVAGLRKIGMLDAQGYVTADPRYTTQVRAAASAAMRRMGVGARAAPQNTRSAKGLTCALLATACPLPCSRGSSSWRSWCRS